MTSTGSGTQRIKQFIAQCLHPDKVNASLKGYANADKDRATYKALYTKQCVATTKAPVGVACHTSSAEVYYCNTNIPSTYNHGTPTTEKSWDECAYRCWKDTACRGWSWTPSKACQLKTNGEKSVMVSQPEYWSGPRRDMDVGSGSGGGGGGSSETPTAIPTGTPVSPSATDSPAPRTFMESLADPVSSTIPISWAVLLGIIIAVLVLSCGAALMMSMMM